MMLYLYYDAHLGCHMMRFLEEPRLLQQSSFREPMVIQMCSMAGEGRTMICITGGLHLVRLNLTHKVKEYSKV